MIKVTHISTVHSRYDIRILHKESNSLANSGFDTFFLVLDDRPNEKFNKVNIINCNPSGQKFSKIKRILIGPYLIYKQIKQITPGVIHFHDPELLFLGIFLRIKKYKVIYDVHENTAAQILTKQYIPKKIRKIISKSFNFLEWIFARYFTGIVCATPNIAKSFQKLDSIEIVNNYPILGELPKIYPKKMKCDEIIFLGGITKIRGIETLVEAIQKLDVRLNLVGTFLDKGLESSINELDVNKKVIYHGQVKRKELAPILNRSFAGIVTFYDAPNHVFAQPNKIFEYMSVGLPVIASNFELWKDIVEKNFCGICVDPQNKQEIANAIEKIQQDVTLVSKMGNQGIRAIEKKYNWKSQEIKLKEFYSKII